MHEPLIRIEVEVVEIQDIMMSIRLLGKFKDLSENLTKDHSNLSNAFSRSILITFWLFYLLYF